MSLKEICQLEMQFKKKYNINDLGEHQRPLRSDEGDNVDKMADMVNAIKHHLDSLVPLVNATELDQAEDNAKAIEHLAQAVQFMLREMDRGNG